MNSENTSENAARPPMTGGKPEWLRKPLVHGDSAVRRAVKGLRLHTVCESARCPNRHECWGAGHTATFMILGDICTRGCGFCNVAAGRPEPPDPEEPQRVARAVGIMGLQFAVLTMVTRDDLPDGGAGAMANTVRSIRAQNPGCRVEVLPSDFDGNSEALDMLLASSPEVVGHNLETVRRLTPSVRSRAQYDRSLEFLRRTHERRPDLIRKSALMVGLGESREEVWQTMDDLRRVHTDVLAIGQYLQPSRKHLPVARYWTPEEFDSLRQEALQRGFAHCESGPWVRSSYRADVVYAAALQARGEQS
ncbi:MAG: lipoyl synthase [Kiritimatiellae bacterium]|nr:lipoyl synthase [Kiritimatiellia bacterium]